ncbi:very-long-chain aldehyde decarbonylase GL1-6-like [Tripterygium wilfordii]|uniref:very-long-chain aldehyde decarbonylase GL1-6-like n=1 Tax=Tripterygium wilfordii TaxID=458696 RepID=UPI0018F7F2D6|nr:very-long-chain aldehyde decarbonylase GL1-6-like [Tripterygium wilfordii]
MAVENGHPDGLYSYSLENRVLHNIRLWAKPVWAIKLTGCPSEKEQRQCHMQPWQVIITMLLRVGPVEFLYYWLHRALHHHYLYSRYHSHHHSSIVTQPITCKQPDTLLNGTVSMTSFCGYLLFLDFMNYMGHCNFELFPKWLFSIFPPIKYLIYTPSFHSLHHSQFRTNYSLFMPIYDYVYNTMDKSTDSQTLLYGPCGHSPYGPRPCLGSMAMYYVPRKREAINESIEEATVEAEERPFFSALALALRQSGIQRILFEVQSLFLLLICMYLCTLCMVWLIGDGVADKEQLKAPKGTLFIPFSQFPPKRMRNDCFYHHTPAMLAPKSFQNITTLVR